MNYLTALESMNKTFNNVSNTYFAILPTRLLDRLMLLLIFMFPLCGNLFQSWFSTLFSLIAIFSLFYIKKGWPLLDKYQKSMAYALLLYFAVFVLNATLLGWQSAEVKALGIEIRLIFILPLLCMAAVIPAARTGLYIGLMGSLVVLLGQAFYELQIIQQWRVTGAYNPLRISAMALVAMAILVPWLYFKKWYVAAVLVLICCIFVIVSSQGRMAMIAAPVVSILFCIILIKQALNKMIALVSIVLIVTTIASIPQIQQRFTEAETLAQYITKEKQYNANQYPGSWVTHYMMLEASWLILKENPVLGVGSRHYHEKILGYVEAKQVHPIVGNNRLVTPHTLIAEIAVSKGVVGLITFLIFIIMALRLAYHRGYDGVAVGMFIVCIVLTGVSEAWWVRTGSFVAIMVVFLAILSTSNSGELSSKTVKSEL